MPDIYSMSDEELSSVDLESLNTSVEDDVEEEEVDEESDLQEMPDEEEEANEDEPDVESEADKELEESDIEETEEDQESETTEPDEDTNVDDESTEVSHEDVEDKVTPKATTKKSDSKDSSVDLEDFYKKVTASFKANGKEMKISNAQDIVALMQQGVNYSKNMADLKPSRSILRTLKERGLDNPEKISYLIDLYDKDPKAIAKLVKDSGLDLYNLEEESTEEYVPTNKVKEQTKIGEVIDSISPSPAFSELLSNIATVWDGESKQFVIDTPEILKVMNEQIDTGEYNQIVERIEYERMLGRYNDIPFIQAYSIIEDELRKNGDSTTKEPVEGSFKGTRPKPKQTNNSAKKRKASAPQSGSKDSKEVFDAFKMSDEELLAAMNKHN